MAIRLHSEIPTCGEDPIRQGMEWSDVFRWPQRVHTGLKKEEKWRQWCGTGQWQRIKINYKIKRKKEGKRT